MAHRLNAIPMLQCWLSLALVFIVGGCADSQGLSRDRLADTIRQEESRFTDGPPASATPPRPNTPTLGLYLKPTGYLNREFEWTGRDRDAVLAWSQGIPLPSGGRSVGFMTVSSLRGQTLTELRASAKRYGVDWLLVFDGAAAVDRYNNYKAGLLYWTILGAYLADGTESDALCLLKAVLWDVKTGALLFEEEAEALTRTVGPAALVDDSREIERARTTAMKLLMDRLKQRFAESAPRGR